MLVGQVPSASWGLGTISTGEERHRNLFKENLIKDRSIYQFLKTLLYLPLTSSGFSRITQVPLHSPKLAQHPISGITHSEGGLYRPLTFSSSQVGSSE